MATYTVIEDRSYLDGYVSVLRRETSRTQCEAFKATTAKGRSSPILYREKDARRWIDEHQIGGDPASFLNELSNRRRGW